MHLTHQKNLPLKHKIGETRKRMEDTRRTHKRNIKKERRTNRGA